MMTPSNVADVAGWTDDVGLYDLANAVPLADPTDRLAALRDAHADYPPGVRREKLFSYWCYATGNAPHDARGPRQWRRGGSRPRRRRRGRTVRRPPVPRGRTARPVPDAARPGAADLDLPDGVRDARERALLAADVEDRLDAVELSAAVRDRLAAAGVPGDRLDRPYRHDPEFDPSP